MTLHLNLFRLKFFFHLARLKNFSKAASACCTTQANISNHINSLEKEIGVKLCYRSSSSFALTEAGHHLFSLTEKIFKDVSLFLEHLFCHAKKTFGVLR